MILYLNKLLLVRNRPNKNRRFQMRKWMKSSLFFDHEEQLVVQGPNQKFHDLLFPPVDRNKTPS